MPNWSDPAEIANDTVIFQKLCLVVLGWYAWEVVTQLPFDWSVISRKREVHWPVIFYFHCKYSLLLALVGTIVATNVTTPVHCQPLYSFNQFVGYTAIGSSSTLLMLRTFAVWNRSLYVMVPMVVVSLGQWALLFHGIVTIRSQWSDLAKTCVVETVAPVEMQAIYMYTMGIDLVVMLLTIFGLVISPSRSSLWQLLFRQGVIYFVAAFIANSLPAIFLMLNLNALLNIMFTIPATTISAIVSCRSFVSLTNFRSADVYVHSTSRHHPSRFRTGGTGYGSTLGRADGGADATLGSKKSKNTVAGIAFRDVSDTMDQTYSMDELCVDRGHRRRSSKSEYDLGDADLNGTVLVHHIETTMNENGVELEGRNPSTLDLESLGHESDKRSFVPAV